jgi:hypothetical protein
MDDNGRIAYDPGQPHKTLSHEDAEALMQLLYERHRGTFGALLAEVVTGQRFTARRLRGAGQ